MPGHEVCSGEMSEPGCANLAAVRLLGSVADEVYTAFGVSAASIRRERGRNVPHLSLGRLDGRVGLSCVGG